MKFKEAKDVFFNSEKIRPVLAEMGEYTREEFFKCFFHCPTKFALKRVDGSKINLTVRVYLDLQDSDKDGKNNLVALFFIWKKQFDDFEKKVLDVRADGVNIFDVSIDYLMSCRYQFLRSSSFLKKREFWKKEGVDKCRDDIKKSYSDYLNRIYRADESLGKYYIIKDNYDSKILANKFTHQLYDLRETMVVAGFAGGVGFSLVPLMVKYEDAYETPIEEHEIWNGKLGGSEGRMLKFSVLFSILFHL